MLRHLAQILFGIILFVGAMWTLWTFSYINGYGKTLVAWTTTASIVAILCALGLFIHGGHGLAHLKKLRSIYDS